MAVRVRFVGSGDSFGSGGRFQTCILVDGPASRFAIDFGCSSLIALAQQDVDPNSIDAILLTPQPARHVPETNPTALRVEVGGRVIAYTGDTAWTDDVARIAHGADLLIAECYFHAKAIKGHLTYDAIVAHARHAGARRMIL